MYIFGAKIIRKIYHETVIIRSVIYPRPAIRTRGSTLSGRGPFRLQTVKSFLPERLMPPSLSKAQIYQQLLKWGQENFNTKESRVAYQNEAKGEIAIIGEEYIVFSSTALSLDRAMMKYRIIIECKEHACTLQLAGIRYEYNVSYQNEPEKYLAEEWITDEYALNKSKTKLNRISGKFRKATIDFADKTFDSATNTLGAQLLDTTPAPT